MSIQYVETFIEARAIPKSVYVWIAPKMIRVYTGRDIPTTPPEDVIVTAWQLREALRQAGKLAEAESMVATMNAARQQLWAFSSTFGRSWPMVENLKNKMPSMNASAFDALFLSASLLQPEVV